MIRAAHLLAIALALSGCDLLTPEPTAVQVSGRVVAADSGEPIEGIWVFLDRPSSNIIPRGEMETSPTGRFTVRHDDGDFPASLELRVNAEPYYDSRYGSFRTRIPRGTTVDLGDIELVVLREPEIP